MPGITGSVSPEAARRLGELEAALYSAPRMRRVRSTAASGFACSVASLLDGSGIAEIPERGVCLAFEGWLAEPAWPAAEIPERLLTLFLARGPAAVEALRGSWQMVVRNREAGETWLLADPVASRRLFYVHHGEDLSFAPEVAPLAGLSGAGAGELDPANLVQFLVSGRFFAGETLLSGVRQLLPGEVLLHRSRPPGGIGGVERRSSFRYQVAADPRKPAADPDLPAWADRLGEIVERAILRAFRQARDPVFLLSGGYDSRYIFHTVARAVPDPSRLRTALFGQRMDVPDSDNVVARAVARRFGVEHLTLPWRGDLLPQQFEEMFAAQSGMTEFVFTHADEMAVFRRLAGEHGCGSVLRGDECFGPRGEEVASVEEGLARVSMSHPRRVADLDRWFGGDGEPWAAAHAARLARLLASAPEDPGALRDTLYGRERLPALQAHHNYHKSHFVEMMNPLLDADVLSFWSTLPAPWRCDKRLFREAYHRRHGDPLDPPIAVHGNGLDWPALLRDAPALAAWVRERLTALPAPLDRGFFLEQLDRVLGGGNEAESRPGAFGVPPVKLVARAVVLGGWWRSGLVR